MGYFCSQLVADKIFSVHQILRQDERRERAQFDFCSAVMSSMASVDCWEKDENVFISSAEKCSSGPTVQ